VARARGPLEQEGTPKDQIDRIRRRLAFLQEKSSRSTWRSIWTSASRAGTASASSSLGSRESSAKVLVRLLQDRKPAIDRATAMLSEALRHEGLLQEDLRKGRGCARSATAPAPGTSGCGRLGWLRSATGKRRSDSAFPIRAPSSTR